LRRLSIFTGRTKGTELNRLDQTQNTAVRGSRQRTLPNKVSRTACGERIYFEISGQNQPCPPALVKKTQRSKGKPPREDQIREGGKSCWI